jgi:hypothetical protein
VSQLCSCCNRVETAFRFKGLSQNGWEAKLIGTLESLRIFRQSFAVMVDLLSVDLLGTAMLGKLQLPWMPY